jgi:S1-C subfamily serine protease
MQSRRASSLMIAVLSLSLVAAAPATRSAAPTSMDAVIPEVPATGTASTVATATPKTSVEQMGRSVVAVSLGPNRVGSAVAVGPFRVLTSSKLVTATPGGQIPAIFTVQGDLLPFTILAEDSEIGLALLHVSLPDALPVVWGDSRELVAGTPVLALGVPTGERAVLELTGTVSSSPISTGNRLVLTNIPIDPLIEGGALVTPDGRLMGIVVSKGLGARPGDLGWAVTSQSAREFVKSYDDKQAAVAAEAASAIIDRWIKRGIMLLALGVFSVLGWLFRRWYKRMEAREEAKAAAEAGAAPAVAEDPPPAA